MAELPGEWRFRIDATDVSDTNYFEDFARGPEGTSVPFAERLLEATYRDEHLNVRAQVQDFQTIDDELAHEDRPYTRAPRLLASGDWDTAGGAFDYGFDAELVNFDRDIGGDGLATRRGAARGLRLVRTPGFFVRPSRAIDIRNIRSRTRRSAPMMRRRARCLSRRWTRAWCSSACADHRDSGA